MDTVKVSRRAAMLGAGATAAMMAAMDQMHASMNGANVTGNANADFVALMVPHHQAAVDMARTYLEAGTDPRLRALAAKIIADQEREIAQMRALGGAEAGREQAHGGYH